MLAAIFVFGVLVFAVFKLILMLGSGSRKTGIQEIDKILKK